MGASWKGSISFGLVYIPINLYTSVDENTVSFNQLHKKCNNRIHYKKVCDVCNEEVERGDIVKGFNYRDDKYVVMTDEDLEKIKSEKDKSITIEQFVELTEIDPIFYEKTYFVVPDGGEKPFELLKQAMKNSNKVGIAKAVFGTKENLLALRVSNDQLILSTMFFTNEIKNAPVTYIKPEIKDNELKMAETLINSMTQNFKPEEYHDEYYEKLKNAIEQKINGQDITQAPQAGKGNITDLMEALQQSIKLKEKAS